MIFEKGSKSNPAGNLIVYCNVNGENPLQPGGRIIASNVVVSFLKIGDNFPVVTFPPVSLDSMDDLRQIISENGDLYDVIKLPDFDMPENKEKANQYIQDRMENFNNLVMKYVDLCKNKERNPPSMTEGEGIRDYLDALAKLSLQFRKSSGLAREAARMKVDKLVDNFAVRHPQYDLENYKRALSYPGQKGEELAGLYLKKYTAISGEEYEKASVLKQQIQEMESYPDSSFSD